MEVYSVLYRAYDFYNKKFFGNLLPKAVITLEYREGIKGYFSQGRFENQKNGMSISQITLNPLYLKKGEEMKFFATLVHEMVHFYVKLMGEKCSYGYHSKKWADEMENIGLIPTSTGKPGGKKLGFVMTQIIDKNGEYYKKTKELIKAGCVFDFVSLKEGNESKTACEKAPQTRVRYKCECSSFWGKKGLKVRCLNCNENFICEV